MIRALLMAVALALAASARADFVYRDDANVIRLQGGACPAEIAALVPEFARRGLQPLVAQIDGKEFRGCWKLRRSDAMVLMQYEDGEAGRLRADEFEQDDGV